MRKLAIGLFALLVPSVAEAASWRFVTVAGRSPNSFTIWIDAETIRRSGDMVSFWGQEILQSPDSTGVTRTASLYRADCTTLSFRSLQVTYYQSGGGSNSRGEDDDNRYAIPGTTMASLIETACGRRALTNPVDDPEAVSRAFWNRGN